MRVPRSILRLLALAAVLAIVGTACSSDPGDGSNASGDGDCTPPDTPVITFAAYSTPREVYGKIISAFQAKWKEEHNDQSVIFQESYGGSTTQAQNVVGGFEADVVALSLGPDVDYIADAGLITHDWTQTTDGGMVSTSVVVLDVRPDNPKGFADFDDIAVPGVGVLTPDPASSGGARWNIVAMYGAAMRGYAGNTAEDEAGAQELLTGVFSNVLALDKTARDSIKNFEAGNGDVAITYENEVFTAQDAGLPDEAVYPPSTVLIANPVAIVDENVDKHCVRDVAEAFVEYLHSDEAKEYYRTVGFLRPTDIEAAAAGDKEMGFPPIDDLWAVEDFGGWDALDEALFSDGGIFTQAFADAQG
ncbi:MAG TPA: sulfate ABC transporter substrate-binding protein [Actinomycetota bacterium]|nr:sulfate ABC transporter substrate-binding protein [Actinomycetota bacterium]